MEGTDSYAYGLHKLLDETEHALDDAADGDLVPGSLKVNGNVISWLDATGRFVTLTIGLQEMTAAEHQEAMERYARAHT